VTLVVEQEGPSMMLAGPIRELVRNLDSSQPAFNVWTIEDYYSKRVVPLLS
jgi:hypothetical protein